MARAGSTKGKAPRITARTFAERVGASVETVQKYMAKAKSYRDAARKWGKRYGVDTSSQWSPWSITAMGKSADPVESFRRAWQNLTQRLDEGVSNLLNTKAEDYANNLMTAMMQSGEFLIDERMQDIVSAYKAGKLKPTDIVAALGGRSLSAQYRKKSDTGEIEIDFSGVIEDIGEYMGFGYE